VKNGHTALTLHLHCKFICELRKNRKKTALTLHLHCTYTANSPYLHLLIVCVYNLMMLRILN